ncbi:MAG: amidohydrolase, partial [Duodenibacillus sp.]|nr:amidohydrolase [Duodenibacillus sp.]
GREGVFEKFGIAEIYGAHTEPMLPKGVFGFKVGPLQAASDFFTVAVHGVGTHGGRPHFGVDPIPVAAQIINAVQTIVSRKINPIHPATVSVCSVNAGQLTTYNVVPHFATLGGTARMFDPADRDLIEEQLGRMVRGIAEANGCTADFEYIRLIGPVINGKEQTEAGMAAAARLFGEDRVRVIEPFTSSEDFAEYLELVPGSMMRVGVRDESHQVSVHNQAFDFNDEVLPAAATLLAAVARDRLEALA